MLVRAGNLSESIRSAMLIAAAAVLSTSVAGNSHAAPIPEFIGVTGGEARADDRLCFDRLCHVGMRHHVTMRDVAVEGDELVDLQLQRVRVVTEDARMIVANGHGEHAFAMPDVVLLRGTVVGEPDSSVFIGSSAAGTHGFVRRHGATSIISSGPHDANIGARVRAWIDRAERLVDPEAALPTSCSVDWDDDAMFPLGRPVHRAARRMLEGAGGRSTGEPPCRQVQVAIDTDFEFTEDLFNGDVTASAAYALTLIGGVSEIYRDQINVSLVVPYIRVFESNDDPFEGSSTGERLVELRNDWRSNQTQVERDLVHLLSGANLGGGIAYGGVLCSNQWGYAVSANINGSFPNPLEHNSWSNWDLVVVAHETGHNLGTGHTHDGFDPALDDCGNGDCTDAGDGTIMSYCHTCPGGLSNIALMFHPEVRDKMLDYLDDACDITVGDTSAISDLVITAAGQATTIDVLANDIDNSCDPSQVALLSFDAASDQGGTVELIVDQTGEGNDKLRFDPAQGFDGVDSFDYQLTSGEQAQVTVTVLALRPADPVVDPQPGLEVDYYDIDVLTQLPDFNALTPYATDVVDDINYGPTTGQFATSGLTSLVGAVFEGFVNAAEPGMYTFSTESNDGSALYIGGDLIVDNDGVHSMIEQTGTIALAAGWHGIRVEFFERYSTAGLIVRVSGPGDEQRSVITSELYAHGELAGACPGDTDGNGSVDVGDLLSVVNNWGGDGSTGGDADGSGTVDVGDLLEVVNNWGIGC